MDNCETSVRRFKVVLTVSWDLFYPICNIDCKEGLLIIPVGEPSMKGKAIYYYYN